MLINSLGNEGLWYGLNDKMTYYTPRKDLELTKPLLVHRRLILSTSIINCKDREIKWSNDSFGDAGISYRPNCGVDIITCVNIYKELPSV